MDNHDVQQEAHTILANSDEPSPNQDHENDTSLEDAAGTRTEKDWEYITGYKLIVVIAATTMAGFIMFLDTSIIATVSINAQHS